MLVRPLDWIGLMSDIPVIFVVSLLLLIVFGAWEHHVTHHTTLPPMVNLAVFTRHRGVVSAVLLSAHTAYISNSVGSTLLHPSRK